MRTATRGADRRYLPVAVGSLLLIAIAGCGTGSAATASPAATVTPTVAATPAPTVAASVAAPSASAKVDPAEGLNIATPYSLAPLNPALEAGLEATMAASMGSMSSIVQIGARTAEKAGVTQSYVIVMRLPGIPITGPGFLDSVAGGAAGTTGQITKQTVLGQTVEIVTAGTEVNMVFILGDRVLFIGGAQQDVELAVITALIQANGA